MPLGALALVLTAAVLHALWNFAAKQSTVPGPVFVWLYVVGSSVVYLPVAVVWVLVLDDRPEWGWLLAGAVTGALHTVYSLVLQRGYERGAMNVVYPVARGVGPLVTAFVALVILGEEVSSTAVVGILAVLAGVLIVATGSRGTDGRTRAGVLWGTATGLMIASYTLWDDHAVNALGVSPVPYFVLGLLLQVPALTLLIGREGRAGLRAGFTTARWQVLAVAVLSPLAYILVLRALQLAPVALVAPVRETSIVIGALLSWLVLREPRPARRLVGAAVMLVGIAAVALG